METKRTRAIEGKRGIYARVSPALYEAIKTAAAQSHRSMSAEAELRLEASLQRENGGTA